MVKRLYNPKTFDYWKKVIAPHFPSMRYVCVCRYVCVHAPVDVHVLVGVVVVGGGGVYVPPCHLVAPTGFANATVWVTLRQFAPHRLIFFFFSKKRYFFTGSVSAYGLTPSCCCFHHYCCFVFFVFFLFFWLYLTALNCCSPGCFIIFIFWSVSVGWSDVNRSRRCEVTTLTRHLHLFLLCLLENKRGGVFFFCFVLFVFFQKKKGIKIKCSKMS